MQCMGPLGCWVMSSFAPLIESVAAATQHRDRDALDASVARLLFEFSEADRVTLSRVLGEGDEARVRNLLTLARGVTSPGADEATDYAALPKLSDRADWMQAMQSRDVVHLPATSKGGVHHSVFPLFGETSLHGLIEIESARALDPRQAQLVLALLRVVRNHVAALEYGERDTLTGLLNRKTFDADFDKLRARCARSQLSAPNWIGVVDIDRFKSINDTYGHLFGDEVLLLVSRLMRAQVRAVDRLFRFGGEEFVAVIENVDEQTAAAVFERIRAAIEHHVFPQIGTVTVSVGFSQIQPSDAPAMAFARADKALYHAKESGRNRVCAFDTLALQGVLTSEDAKSEIELF